MDQHPVAVRREAALEQIDPDGEQRLGHCRGVDQRQRARNGKAGPRRRDAIFGIAAAGDQRANLLADQLRRPRAASHHLSGYLEAQHIGRARRRRIHAPPLQHVGPIHPGRRDLDQHLARPRLRHRPLDDRQAAGPVGNHRAHGGGKFRHARAY